MGSTHEALWTLLRAAWLLPLASFALIAVLYSVPNYFGKTIGKAGRYGAFLATGAIVSSFLLSVGALWYWANSDHAHATGGPHVHVEETGSTADSRASGARSSDITLVSTGAEESHPKDEHAGHEHGAGGHDTGAHHGGPAEDPVYYSGEWYNLAEFGKLRVSIGYYIDGLTIVMFCMVTLIASCIHFYAMGYMKEELDDVTDHEVTLSSGEHLTRRGRYHRFFQSLSLFCFSMLGVVISGNLAMTFVFWELVGICSYFLIGFYIERKNASDAANKAFIVNRVGDFGMIIGLMALWVSLGTFNFGDSVAENGERSPGIFSQARPAMLDGKENHHALVVPDGMVRWAARERVSEIVLEHPGDLAAAESQVDSQLSTWRDEGYGYWLLVIAGLGIFCGCVGKSAQFPLHVWLPDAMEGPTPVSALVHSATMVAAGVFLVARFYPLLTPEALIVIAVIGCITLFMAATIAITATDIKRVLAYSTLSQLGYMMFALGIGGWMAGVLHLITHAFFKSLLFMCSGSVIHAVHSNEMTDMGGLLKKMPITAATMLIGCLAIIGAGIPTVVGLSGYYSKDSIIAQAMHFQNHNGLMGFMFFAAAGGAAITAFYMFRLWFMTFLGPPRDKKRHDHAHESPWVMTVPLLVLSFFAVFVATPSFDDFLNPMASPLVKTLESARPAGTNVKMDGTLAEITVPDESGSHAHEIHVKAGLTAFCTALGGVLLAASLYWWRLIDPEEVRQQFRKIHRFLINKWWFDELYEVIWVKPTHLVSAFIAGIDKHVFDRFLHALAAGVKWFSVGWDKFVDQGAVDGSINKFAEKTWDLGIALRGLQTGRLRQYAMFIAIGTVVLFVLITVVRSMALAG